MYQFFFFLTFVIELGVIPPKLQVKNLYFAEIFLPSKVIKIIRRLTHEISSLQSQEYVWQFKKKKVRVHNSCAKGPVRTWQSVLLQPQSRQQNALNRDSLLR